jgi:hypothetical protein
MQILVYGTIQSINTSNKRIQFKIDSIIFGSENTDVEVTYDSIWEAFDEVVNKDVDKTRGLFTFADEKG